MRSSRQAAGKAVATLETVLDERKAKADRYRVHLASAIVSDMFDDHAACRFKDCRKAGRCLALDKYTGVCPMPLDTARSMIFVGMIWFHDAIRAAQAEARQAREEEARKIRE
jgi:hypothetical protein